jgi:hypothetical protein
MNINDLQITQGNWHAGLTQSNHLRSFFLLDPVLATSVITRVYNRYNGAKNPLSFLTVGTGRAKELPDIIYRWPLMGDSEKAIPVIENKGDGGSTPGINKTTFRVVFPEKWFAFGDVLVPDNTDYPVRVMDYPVQESVGDGWVYTLQLVTNDDTKFMPLSLLEAGKEFSKDFNLQEHDHSRESGETHYATPFWMENYMSTFRKKYTVTGAAGEKVLSIKLMNPDGSELASTWVKYAEWEFWCQWQDEIERALWYGKTNIDNTTTIPSMKGISGNPVYASAGVEDQIAPANKRYYTRLTEKTIRNFMNDLAFGGVEDGPRNYVAMCGRGFMDLFDQAMKDSASRYTLVDSKFVTGSGQELALGGQFITYMGLNGDSITLKELKLYNNPIRNRQVHPETGLPAESYKATFLNFKMNSKGESNIMKVYHKGREMVTTYIEGLYGPYGPKKNGTSATAVDGYEFHAMSECGVMIQDPTDCGQLILDVNAL